jgi:hypothetical protein
VDHRRLRRTQVRLGARFAAADTLVYIEGSPVLSSTISSYRVLWPCHRHLTPKYRELVSAVRPHKRVHHLRSAAEIDAFLNGVRLEALVTTA